MTTDAAGNAYLLGDFDGTVDFERTFSLLTQVCGRSGRAGC